MVIASPQLLTPVNRTLSDSVAVSRPAPLAVVQPRVATKAAHPALSSTDSLCLMLSPIPDDHLFSLKSSRSDNDRVVARLSTAADYDTSPNTAVHTSVRPSSALPNKPLGQTSLGADSVWIFIVSLIGLSFIGFIHMRFSPFISPMISLLTSSFNWRSVVESLKVQRFWAGRILFAASCILLSLAAYEIVTAAHLDQNLSFHGFKLFAIIFMLLVSALLFKILFNYLLGFAFDNTEPFSHLSTSRLLSYDILGVIVAPFVVILPFVREDSYPLICGIMIFMIISMYIWRLLSAAKFILSDYLSVFYSFLYLCAVELIPIAVICKIAAMFVS